MANAHGVALAIRKTTEIKMFSRLIALIACVLVAGCATSTFTTGQDFPAEKVQLIVKGKTTALELTSMMGEPFQKTVVSANQEQWSYKHIVVTASAQSYIFTMKVESNSAGKSLSVLIQDDIVVNFTYSSGPMSSSTTQ